MELSELLTEIETFVGDDTAKAREVADALRGKAGTKEVAQHLINIGNRGKETELGKKVKKLEDDLRAANETIQAKELELEEKVPNAKVIEERVKAKYESQVADEKKKREAAEQRARDLQRAQFSVKLEKALKEKDEKGVTVGEEDDDLIRGAIVKEYLDRYVEKEDGTEDVLQLDSSLSYDGKNLDEKITALRRDLVKSGKIPSKYLITSAGGGGGITNDKGKKGKASPWKELREDIEKERGHEITGPTASERLRGIRTRPEQAKSAAR